MPLASKKLVFFFGEIAGEIVGIVSYIVRTPDYQAPQVPAR
jgi:hypothetical protein